ncbi:MAG: DEAD/DEAH box helicase family protein [Patescibacteria group bacterium]
MRNSFNEHLTNFQDWRENGYALPYISDKAKEEKIKHFLKYLDSDSFKNSSKFELYHFQTEAIKRTIYSFEMLGKKDLLLNIVTGGGKTVIIAGIIAYLRIAHDFNKFLILVPNTIVRQRLVDAFNPASKTFVFDEFKFFFNSYDYLKDRFSLHIMEQGKDPSGVRTANIILGNIHQIYEGKTNLAVLMDKANVDQIAIFNDEAHNTKAKQYNLLLHKLKPKRFIRIDTTATPERLDGLHPDSEMILEYGIKQAMRDKIVKRIVVFKPDVDIVKLKWKDEEGKVYSVDEIPWEQIEKGWVARAYDGKRVKIPAVKYVTDQKPAAQLLNVALQCLEYQKKGVPLDTDGKPKYKPLLFIVTFSISDAKQVAKILRGVFKREVLVVHNEAPEADKEIAMQLNQDMKQVTYDAIVSVMMLREGWDVKNIAVICLFRKFCYKQVGDKIMSVYGPQVIGRGLRRIIISKDRWESLYVVDHPILKHNWLWDQLDAAKYEGSLNPGDIIDEQKLPEEQPDQETRLQEDDAGKLKEKINEEIDWKKLAEEVPDFIDKKKVIADWQKFLDNYEYILEGVSIEEKINQIKSRNLDSGFTVLEKGEDIPNISVSNVETAIHYSREELQKIMLKEMSNTAKDALVEYDGNPDSRQTIIYDVLNNHIKKRFLGGSEISRCDNKSLLELFWDTWSQIRENFLKPELIEGILANK